MRAVVRMGSIVPVLVVAGSLLSNPNGASALYAGLVAQNELLHKVVVVGRPVEDHWHEK